MTNMFAPLLLSVFPLLLLTGCVNSTRDIPNISGFHVERYMGTWYEIARLPHSFENGMTCVTAEYALQPDGLISVENSGCKDGVRKKIRGVAKGAGPPGTGELRVSFFQPFYGKYRIVRLEPDYSSAIVTSGTRDYLWILSRSRKISAARRAEYLKWIKDHGYDADRLIWVETCRKSSL